MFGLFSIQKPHKFYAGGFLIFTQNFKGSFVGLLLLFLFPTSSDFILVDLLGPQGASLSLGASKLEFLFWVDKYGLCYFLFSPRRRVLINIVNFGGTGDLELKGCSYSLSNPSFSFTYVCLKVTSQIPFPLYPSPTLIFYLFLVALPSLSLYLRFAYFFSLNKVPINTTIGVFWVVLNGPRRLSVGWGAPHLHSRGPHSSVYGVLVDLSS